MIKLLNDNSNIFGIRNRRKKSRQLLTVPLKCFLYQGYSWMVPCCIDIIIMMGNNVESLISDNGSLQLFLAHLSRRLIGELIVYQWSVVHNAQRSSSPKPLVQSKPNFMWSLLG